MGPKQVQIDNLDRVPQGAGHDSAPWGRSPRVLFDWRGLLVLCVTVIIGGLLLYWLFGRSVQYWLEGNGWLPYAVFLLFVLFLVKRLLLVEQPGGYKVFFWQADGREVTRGMLATQRTYAARTFPNAAQLTLTGTTLAPELPDAIEGEVIEENALALVPDHDWLAWIDRTPHLMIAGRTEAGKTTMAEAVIAQRASAGELLYVLDPHYQPGKWCGLPAVGGGRGYGEVMQGLEMLLGELDSRYIEFNQGKPTEQFDRLTVFIDEVPALVEWCFDGKTLRDRRWLSFAKQLGSEARKVRISVILMTQSPLVQDILINTRMRENFTRIALGDQSIELIKEERDAKRRQELTDLLRGRQYTAAMEYRNEVHALDTTNVPHLASRRVAHVARPWQPPQITVRPVVSASAQASATVRTSVSAGAIIYPPTVKSTNGKIAWLLRQGYSYRQIERELSVSHATISMVSKALKQRGTTP